MLSKESRSYVDITATFVKFLLLAARDSARVMKKQVRLDFGKTKHNCITPE